MSVGPDIQRSGDSGAPAPDAQVGKPIDSPEIVARLPSSNPEPEPSRAAALDDDPEEDDFHPGLRLWIIIVGLGVTLLLTALENTAITVAIPIIVSELDLGENYIWVTNAFFISRYVPTHLPPIRYLNVMILTFEN